MELKNIVAVILLYLKFGVGEQLTKEIGGGSGGGLYFEETGQIYFYNEEWKIVLNVNISKYRTEVNNNKNIIELILNNCEELKLIEIMKNTSSKSADNTLMKYSLVVAILVQILTIAIGYVFYLLWYRTYKKTTHFNIEHGKSNFYIVEYKPPADFAPLKTIVDK